MITFTFVALAMLALALAILLVPLRRASPAAAAPPPVAPAHLPILREQLAQLDADYAAGVLDTAQHRQARAEIERRALEEHSASSTAPPARVRSGLTAGVVASAIVVLSASLYAALGNRAALAPEMAADGDRPSIAQVEAMVAQLAQRLENPPSGQTPDPEAWEMLGRSYAALQRFAEADRAYARAIELKPDSARLLADRADVLIVLQGQSAAGEPTRLVLQALAIDPKNLKALALAGSAAYERGNLTAARGYWTRARDIAPAGGEFAQALDRSLAQLPAGLAQSAGVPAVSVAPLAAASAAALPARKTVAVVRGIVRLAPNLTPSVRPDDTVFVFARAAQGPRMPLAVLKYRAADLPVNFTLDDSTAMTPDLRLSLQSQVVVSARVSRSGNASPQSGDLLGQSVPLVPGGPAVEIVIDQAQP